MAARVVVRELSVSTVIWLPCTVTVPAVIGMDNPAELIALLVLTAAPTSVAPNCLADVAIW